MNSSRPGESLNMSPKQLKHLKLLQSLTLELQYMRDQILKKLRHKKLGDYSPEDQNLSLNPVIQGLSGRTVTTIQRLEDDSIRLLKYCNRAMVSPECANLHVRARVEQSVRPLIRHLRLLTCNLTTILTAYRTHQSRRSQQERSALRECADLLVYQTPEWTGPQGQSYIFYMQKFLSAQEFIPNKSAKFLNLKRAMKKVPRAVAVVSYYDGSQDYNKCLAELNSVFASTRKCWSDSIRLFEELPSEICTLSEQRALHGAIRQFRSYLDFFEPLRQFSLNLNHFP